MTCIPVHEPTDTLKSHYRHRLSQNQADIYTEGKRYGVAVGQILGDIDGSITIAWGF